MPQPARQFVKASRHDDFVVILCPDDREFLCPFLLLGSRFGAKALAQMALQESIPQGVVVQQYDVCYLYYDGLLWLLDDDMQLADTSDDPLPALEPRVENGREAMWFPFVEE